MKKEKTFIEMTKEILTENPDWTDYFVYDLGKDQFIINTESNVSKWTNRDILKDIAQRVEGNKITTHYINFKSRQDDVNVVTIYIGGKNFYICVNTILGQK